MLTCGVDCGESCAACKERTEATGVAENTGRNEALDVRVYVLSAFVNLNANLDQLAKSLKAKSIDERQTQTPQADTFQAIKNRPPRRQGFVNSWKT